MDKKAKKDTDRYGSMYKRDMNNEWVHDMYRADSLNRKENTPATRADYYNGPGKRRIGELDSYKPTLGDSDINSYRPLSRGNKERYDDGRYAVDKPTVYKSHVDYLVEKSFAAGISSDEYYSTYYRYGRRVTEEKPTASAYWLLWRHECMIWKKFCRSH